MDCTQCGSFRVAIINSYGRDCQYFSIGNKEHQGYGYEGSGLASGDSLGFNYCMNCGQIQNVKFPLPITELEEEDGK